MKFSATILRYVFKYYVAQFAIVAGVFCLLIFLVEGLETMRRTEGKDVAFSVVMLISTLRLASVAIQALPFAALIGGILTYRKLAHHAELIAMRACGVSAWQFVAPAALAAFALGLAALAFLDPLSAGMLNHRERVQEKYLGEERSVTSLLASGLWLKQPARDGAGKTLIRASRLSPDSDTLYNAVFFIFDASDKFVRRVEASEAVSDGKQWHMRGVRTVFPGEPPLERETYSMPASISAKHIRESFLSPENFAFWRLPEFIKILRDSGFPVAQHVLHYYKTIFSPLFLATMAAFGAAFSLAHMRGGKGGAYAVAGLGAGFFIYFMNDIFYALGLSGKFPPIAAALAAPVICFAGSAVMLLHKEE